MKPEPLTKRNKWEGLEITNCKGVQREIFYHKDDVLLAKEWCKKEQEHAIKWYKLKVTEILRENKIDKKVIDRIIKKHRNFNSDMRRTLNKAFGVKE